MKKEKVKEEIKKEEKPGFKPVYVEENQLKTETKPVEKPAEKKVQQPARYTMNNFSYDGFWTHHIGKKITVHCKDGKEFTGVLQSILYQQMNVCMNTENDKKELVHRVFRGDTIAWCDIERSD